MTTPEGMTWDGLAAALNIPVREVYRERKLPGAPTGKDVEAWREYFAGKGQLDLQGLTPTTYDDRLKSGKIDLDKALVHARLVEQEIINERRREELKRVRGDVVPREKVEDKIREVTAAALEVLNQLPDIVANDAAPHDRPEARRKARLWVETIRTKMAERLRLG